jgi:hypothetical protein
VTEEKRGVDIFFLPVEKTMREKGGERQDVAVT